MSTQIYKYKSQHPWHLQRYMDFKIHLSKVVTEAWLEENDLFIEELFVLWGLAGDWLEVDPDLIVARLMMIKHNERDIVSKVTVIFEEQRKRNALVFRHNNGMIQRFY